MRTSYQYQPLSSSKSTGLTSFIRNLELHTTVVVRSTVFRATYDSGCQIYCI